MIDKKYEFTGETKEYGGRTLHRIRALRDFGNVKKGDLGGWIESEKNLSHEWGCWVADEAMVLEDAEIISDAIVCDKARVQGKILAFLNATIAGEAFVFGDITIVGGNIVDAMIYDATWRMGAEDD